MCHGKKRGEKCRTKGEEEERAKGTRWFADYLASRVSSDYKVYPFTGWELPEEAGDARGVICTQKREAKPRYATRAFRGKREKPDDEAVRKERNVYLLESDTRPSRHSWTKDAIQIHNWKPNEYFQWWISVVVRVYAAWVCIAMGSLLKR